MLPDAVANPLLMSVVNWGEVCYSVWRTRGLQAGNAILAAAGKLPISLLPVDQATAEQAAMLKAEYNLPYADSFAAALALRLGATVVTGDRDFSKVAKLVKILWLP